jgi:hypothetical protein
MPNRSDTGCRKVILCVLDRLRKSMRDFLFSSGKYRVMSSLWLMAGLKTTRCSNSAHSGLMIWSTLLAQYPIKKYFKQAML